MQSYSVMDSIEVIAAFKKGKVVPLVFSWRGRRYQDFKVIKSWDKFDNRVKVLYYTVKLENACYEIFYNTGELNWSLTKVLSFF